MFGKRKRWSLWSVAGGVEVHLGAHWTRRGVMKRMAPLARSLRLDEGVRLEVRLQGHPGPYVIIERTEPRRG